MIIFLYNFFVMSMLYKNVLCDKKHNNKFDVTCADHQLPVNFHFQKNQSVTPPPGGSSTTATQPKMAQNP